MVISVVPCDSMENNDSESKEFKRFKVLEINDILVNTRESEVDVVVEVFRIVIKDIDDITDVIDKLVIEILVVVSENEIIPLRGLVIPELVIAMLLSVIV